MTGMFPGSGVPPADAKNSLADPDTINCDELWYSTSRCQPRFDPAAANAELAELINLVNQGEVQYDCTKLDQVQLATRYLMQRGLMSGAGLAAGATAYTAAMVPPATRYNDWMEIKVTPNVNNAINPTLALNGLAALPIVRNDGVGLKANDLTAGIPVILVQYQGKWYVPGYVKSQVLSYDTVMPYFSIYDGGNTQNVPNNTNTVLTTINSNVIAPFFLDPATITGALGKFTVGPKDAGVWILSGSIGLELSSVSSQVNIAFAINGGTPTPYMAVWNQTGATWSYFITRFVRMAVGDYVQLSTFQNSGATRVASAQAFAGVRISA